MEKSQALVPVSVGASASLIKHLASCNKGTRDKALRALNSWLPLQPQISDDDMKKLWKGLFYCVWHADKAPVQADLINRLSSLLLTLDLPLAAHYLAVFLLTMRREWSGIDALRLDKFYLLIRRFVNCVFILLKKNKWDLELIRSVMTVLEEKSFFADDNFLGNGVNYHIASVFLEELKHFLPAGVETLDIMFKPFFSVMGKSHDKVLVGKVKSNVFDVLLKMGKSLLERRKLVGDVGDDAVDETVNFGTIAMTMGFSAKLYDMGSSPDCLQWNRKVLFGLHKEFLKLDKDLELSGIEISVPVVKDSDDNEVPQLIPIVSSVTEVVSTSTANSSKKNKKAKKGSDGSKKKSKMKKSGISLKNENEDENENDKENENAIIANGENSINELTTNGNIISFNESVISNLQMQFEKVAAEVGLDTDDTNSIDLPNGKITIKGTISKKRKRARSKDAREPRNPDHIVQGEAEGDAAAKSTDKSTKKVRFSIKNNLVWKPQSPLPPQNLRLPPSVTPRGSALKKGVSPGPIREMPSATKRVKQKKGRKGIKTISPAIKRLRKLQALSI